MGLTFDMDLDFMDDMDTMDGILMEFGRESGYVSRGVPYNMSGKDAKKGDKKGGKKGGKKDGKKDGKKEAKKNGKGGKDGKKGTKKGMDLSRLIYDNGGTR